VLESLLKLLKAGYYQILSYDNHKYYRYEFADGIRSPVMPGRNDPCCCGSGKKYKKCCGSKGE